MALSASASLSNSAAALYGGLNSGVPGSPILTNSMVTVVGSSSGSKLGSAIGSPDYSPNFSGTIAGYSEGLPPPTGPETPETWEQLVAPPLGPWT